MAIVRIQSEPFNPSEDINKLLKGTNDTGGLVTFQGLVRRTDKARKIKSLTLEHYPGMTERVLRTIARDAELRFGLCACLIIHRYGRLLPMEPIVLVATASPHRKAAFDAAEFIMDKLKTSAPFWKYEETDDETGQWVDAKTSDDDAVARWQS